MYVNMPVYDRLITPPSVISVAALQVLDPLFFKQDFLSIQPQGVDFRKL